MGNLSADHLGAVGIGAMIFNMIYWNFGFLRMGTTGMTAQSFGANAKKDSSLILYRSLFLALFIALLLLLFSKPICQASLSFMNVIPDQESWVVEYFKIRIWAAPGTMVLYVVTGWFFGMQNAVYPLVITLVVNVLNLALSFYFVLILKWDIAGVAYGTVIAQYCGVLLSILFIRLKYREYLNVQVRQVVNEFRKWMALLHLNMNLFIRTVCLTFAFAFFYSMSSKAGPIVLAANVILLQFLNWMSYGIDGFAFASESLVGRFYGARNSQYFKSTIYLSFVWAFALALIYSTVFFIFGRHLINIFTNDIQVQTYAVSSINWLAIMPIVAFVCYIWDGIYIGLTAGKQMRDTMLIALVIYFAVYYFLSSIGEYAIWYAFIIFLIARGVLMTLYWYMNNSIIFLKSAVNQ